jgi:hypothetical protein
MLNYLHPPPQNENPLVTVYREFDVLMNNPDTSLQSEKKSAQRWMSYVLPYLEVEDGKLSNSAFRDAMNQAITSSSGCIDDPADWTSDGPMNIPDWQGPGNRTQTSGGWVDGVYNNPTDPDVFLIGTRTSGLMRTTDGGLNWTCVTDGLDFPALGTRRMVAAPDNPNLIVVATGTEFIQGNVIYSVDNGQTWSQVQQVLPDFYWMEFHPSVDGLIFATSDENIYYSNDYGVSWSILGSPPSYTQLYNHFDKIIVLEDQIYFNTQYIYNGLQTELYQADLTLTGNTVSASFSIDVSQAVLPQGPTSQQTSAIRFSNVVGERFLLQVRLGTGPFSHFTLRTLNGGSSFETVNTTININLPRKNELITSLTDPDVYFYGSVPHPRKYVVGTPGSIVMNGTPGANGHHDDYRSSQILLVNGVERIVYGNDGGVCIVENALASQPTLTGINGNLSINLIHAFDIHEKTKRAVYAFQDHSMIYRDEDGNFSSRFIWEGSAALTQQLNNDAIVGENAYTGIMDKTGSPNPIVNGILASGRCNLGGYFTTYRHFPERFARGLRRSSNGTGGVAMNRAKLVSEISEIPLCIGNVGPVAICERDPAIMYAAEWERLDHPNILFKTIDDGITWQSISYAPVSHNGQITPLRNLLYWRHIRALAVNHTNPDILYCGAGGTLTNGNLLPGELRVFKSFDGGNSFIDYSEGLPALPIERMLTIDSSNDLVFCGTSAGVFYRTANMTQWECFSNGLPNAQITGMKYDYCDNILYVSTYGRGMWKTPMNLTTSSGTAIEITENTLWDTDRAVYDDILVKAGNTLTITSKVSMGKMKGIRVEPNATLIVDGGKVGSFCNSMWRGIEVWGDVSQHQYYDIGVGQYFQGRAIFKNNAEIENAWEGVQNWNPADWNSRGGIIQASNTSFINCRIAAIFMKYQNTQPSNSNVNRPDQSFFRLCNFILDDNIFDDPNQLPPRPRVTLWNTNGVRFEGCNFENTQNVDASEKRVVAIYSHDANYLVKERCTSPSIIWGQPCQNLVPSTFSGWHTAIKALETSSGRPILVRDSEFEKNMIGVEIDGTDFSQIYRNKFKVGGHPFPDWGEEPYYNSLNHLGIYSNSTLHFTIEQNEVKKEAGAQYEGHGVLMYDSKGAENQIYKNEFQNLRTGVDALQVNRSTTFEGGVSGGAAGLQFLCNQNSGNEVDFEISRTGFPGSVGYEEAGVRREHGSDSPDFPAENNFSAPNSNPSRYTHFDVSSNHTYRYFFHATSPIPAEITPGAFANPLIQVDPTNNCPLNFTTPGGIKYEVLVERRNEFESLKYTYNQIIDQGNTQGTITEIELTWPEHAWELRDEFMLRSPYNSEEVLRAAIQKNIMPHAMLLEVLLANPDALRDGRVVRVAENDVVPPMPQYMIDLLYAARNETTLRTAMESTLANLHMDVQRLQKKLLTAHVFADSTSSSPDSTLHYLNFVKTVEGNYSRASAMADRDMYSAANDVLDSMLTNYRLSNDRAAEMNKLKDLYSLLGNVHDGDKTIANLDSSDIQAMKTIAEDESAGIAARKAQNALCFHYDICYDRTGQPKSGAQPLKPKPSYKELVSMLNTATAYPNPADGYVTLAYTLLHSKANTTMVVYDGTGRKLETRNLGEGYEGQQLFDTRRLSSGVYLYHIAQEGKKVNEGKFIVTH